MYAHFSFARNKFPQKNNAWFLRSQVISTPAEVATFYFGVDNYGVEDSLRRSATATNYV